MEAWAHIFFIDEDEACKIVIEEEMQPMQTDDPLFAMFERAFWEGRDPFEDFDMNGLLKRFLSKKKPKAVGLLDDKTLDLYNFDFSGTKSK